MHCCVAQSSSCDPLNSPSEPNMIPNPQEAIARIAAETFIITSAQMMVNSMLANHEQPAVLSAVMKSQTTHRARLVSTQPLSIPEDNLFTTLK